MKKIINTALLLISILMLALSVTFAFGCSDGGDKTEWNISSGIVAKFSDNGKHGFILNIEGEGKMPDYSSKKDAPWYGKSGRVTGITVSEGITSVGANAFTDIKAKTVVLPKTVASVGANAFNADTFICAYGSVSAAEGVTVYTYSETQPTEAGNFWHEVNGVAVKWQPADTKTKKVLFIGNSFTFYSDIPALFKSIAEGAGVKVISESVTQGSHTLTKFADKNDEFGRIVDEKLTANSDYDAVVLQEQSVRPLNEYNEFLAAVKSLDEKIKSTQKDCKVYLYSTWGYKSAADARRITIPEMELSLRTAYENAAKEIGARVSHVGKAFTAVYNAHKEVNDEYCANPDKFASSPEKGFALYFKDDNKHPSYSGAFLSASVHVATILGIDPSSSVFTGELDAAAATELKSIANTAVFG